MPTWNLADLWETLADAAGDAEVLVAGDVRQSYRELDERANRLAHHLAAAGIGEGDRVGVYSYNRAEFVEALLAAYKLRAIPLNVNFRYVEAELAYIFRDSGMTGLVYERSFAPQVAALAPDFPELRTLVEIADASETSAAVPGAVDYEDALAAASPERGFPARSADDLYIIYTGGTTGMPKGTMWRHEDIFHGAMGGGTWCGGTVADPADIAKNAELDFRVTFGVLAPLMHGAAQWMGMGGLLGGGRVVVYPQRHFDPHAVLQMVATEKVNTISVVGDAMARPIADAMRERSYDLSSLFSLGSGGAVLSDTVKDELRAGAPNLMVMDTYGSSELGAGGRSAADGLGARFAVEGDVAVLDEETLKPVEPGSGAVGKIGRRGHIPLGYWGDPEKTASTFPTVDGVRWAIPGDYATVEADGTVVLLGRGSVCINTGGEKVYPEEVEAALKAHPAVYDAIVVGIADPRWTQRVVAVVAPRPGESPSLDELEAHCRTLVAGYKVPRQIALVDEVRRTPVGKADYAWAREVAEAAVAPD